MTHDLDLLDLGGMHGEGALDTRRRDLANREGLAVGEP